MTWIQPEDLVGHELRQAREAGLDVDDVAARWRAAGGRPAPARGASQEPVPAELRALALELLDELDRTSAESSDDEPDALDAIVSASGLEPPRQTPGDDLAERLRGAWTGRVVGCVLGKPVEGLPREGIRELAAATGRLPLDRYFTAVGLPADVAERWPWNRASRATSLEENLDGAPEDDDVNFTLLALELLERSGREFTTEDVARLWLDLMPPGRVFTAERVAVRNLLLALLPPETATHHNPFREWIGARLRVDIFGWASAGDPLAAAGLAWRDARLSHTANGVYAAMWMAAVHAWSLVDDSASAAADAGLAVVPAASRLGHALRLARDAARADDWDATVDALYARLGELHWVHAINNTALVAAALYAFDRDFDGAVGAVVTGGWDTDTNGAAVGSVLGAIVGPGGIAPHWTEPLRGRIASSLPSFDGFSIDEGARRTLSLAVTRP